MKKSLKTLFFLLLAILMINCEEDVKNANSIDGLIGQATINGTVFVNNDRSFEDTTTWEAAPNAPIRVYYYAKDLSYTTDLNAPDYVISIDAVTDNQGRFSVTVPTIAAGVDFYIEADEYKTELDYLDIIDNVIFQSISTSVSLKTNEDVTVEMFYEDYNYETEI